MTNPDKTPEMDQTTSNTSDALPDAEIDSELQNFRDTVCLSGATIPNVRSHAEIAGVIGLSGGKVMMALQCGVGGDIYHALRRLAADALYVAACMRCNEDM